MNRAPCTKPRLRGALPEVGVEPTRPRGSRDFESRASANSATLAIAGIVSGACTCVNPNHPPPPKNGQRSSAGNLRLVAAFLILFPERDSDYIPYGTLCLYSL